MKSYRRTLSDEEKWRLRQSLPWFGKARRERLTDIEQGVADVNEFEFIRIWNINGCGPSCCPHTLLFETTDDVFVYVESWKEIERRENVTDETRLIIESTPTAKRLIKLRIEGPAPIRHTEQLRELNEFFEMDADAEWRTFKKAEMRPEVLTILEAV